MANDDRQPPIDPASMSVDHLTQAFANLMADPDDGTADDAIEENTAAVDPDEDEATATPETIVEAILFVGHPENQAISPRAIASYLRGVSPHEVDQIVADLNDQYTLEQTPFTIVSDGSGYRMTLREEFVGIRESFYGRVRQAKLSQPAVDLLAIVAYHQPIARDDIERLRGQASGGVLSQLVRRQLLQIQYTTEKPRKKLYRTTERFLDLFGLDSLDDLPSHE